MTTMKKKEFRGSRSISLENRGPQGECREDGKEKGTGSEEDVWAASFRSAKASRISSWAASESPGGKDSACWHLLGVSRRKLRGQLPELTRMGCQEVVMV